MVLAQATVEADSVKKVVCIKEMEGLSFCTLNLAPITMPSLCTVWMKRVCNAWSEITTIPFSIALVNIGFECVPVGRLDYD